MNTFCIGILSNFTDLDVAPHHLLLLGVPSLHHGIAGGVLGGEELVGAGRHVGLHGLLVGLGAPLHVVNEGVLEALVALTLSDVRNKSVKGTFYSILTWFHPRRWRSDSGPWKASSSSSPSFPPSPCRP